MANKNCGQVTIPTVDNTSLECDEFVSSKCVKVDYDSVSLKTINNHPTLYEFVEILDGLLKNINKHQIALKVKNDKLLSEIRSLKLEVNNLQTEVNIAQKEILILKNNNNNV